MEWWGKHLTLNGGQYGTLLTPFPVSRQLVFVMGKRLLRTPPVWTSPSNMAWIPTNITSLCLSVSISLSILTGASSGSWLSLMGCSGNLFQPLNFFCMAF
uniref:Uncharacterized protein n=1 Tax=Engystomops pustulosus TaxID=76066 RepID=A0AAV6YQ42_ENGPU|nr:hypothetical protein GDO81_020791 [Engystomops pustulosus]